MVTICRHKVFDYVILVFILLSCVVLAMEGPGIEKHIVVCRWLLCQQCCNCACVQWRHLWLHDLFPDAFTCKTHQIVTKRFLGDCVTYMRMRSLAKSIRLSRKFPWRLRDLFVNVTGINHYYCDYFSTDQTDNRHINVLIHHSIHHRNDDEGNYSSICLEDWVRIVTAKHLWIVWTDSPPFWMYTFFLLFF